MSPRLFCNVVYAHVMAPLEGEQRDRLDRDLYAPLEGWDAAQRRAFARMGVNVAPTEGGG